MQALYLLAALAMAADEPKKPGLVNLKDLMGPSVPGPAAGPSGSSSSSGGKGGQAFLAALDVFEENAAVAMKCWGPEIGQLQGEPFSEAHVKQAAALFRKLVKDGKLKTSESSERGTGGTWAPDIQDKRLVGGEFNASVSDGAIKDRHNPQGWSNQKMLVEAANSILHETAHALRSYFEWEKGAVSTSQPSRVSIFPTYFLWDGKRPSAFCPKNPDCPYVKCGDDPGCWKFSLSDSAHSAKGYSGDEHCARQISSDLHNATSGQAAKRVLAPFMQ